MKRFCLAILVIALVLMAGVSYAQECKRLGVRECRPGTPKGVCYWWECQQTGSVMQMVFTGKTCTCPRSEMNSDSDKQAAKSGSEIEIAQGTHAPGLSGNDPCELQDLTAVDSTTYPF